MSVSYLFLEIAVVLSGLGLLLVDLWTPAEHKRGLGYMAAGAAALILAFSFSKIVDPGVSVAAFGGSFTQDALALFFKRFFLLAAVLILLMEVEFSDRITAGITEYYALTLFALAGMMVAASVNDFALLFVSLELMAVTFYVLTSFQRTRLGSLEAGVKYLILGAVSSAILVYGIALIYGSAGTMNFTKIADKAELLKESKIAVFGFLLVLVGLGFKVAVVPMQIWAPDVYQGAPTPTSAFLAVGSKAAGFALLLRVLHGAAPELLLSWERLLMILSGLTILYGSLCAIPQRNLKRLLGYSSIANAGYLFLGISAGTVAGVSAILYYLAGYLFAVVAAFFVICIVSKANDSEDISEFAGLSKHSPFLASVLALSMVSLAGVPPMAGFFGKFLLLKSAAEQAVSYPGYYVLLGVAIIGVVISLYYYFEVVRAIYWSPGSQDRRVIILSKPAKLALWTCAAGMVLVGVFPNLVARATDAAAAALKF